MWSEQGDVPHAVAAGRPAPRNASAAALLAYDVPHRRRGTGGWASTRGPRASPPAPTSSPLALALAGALAWSIALALGRRRCSPGVFSALTGVVLVWDLEHPRRFLYIFTRPQWRSWLVRGAVSSRATAAVLVAHLAARLRRLACRSALARAGSPLAAMTAAYTAYLFAQAKARDLWQSPLLLPHLLVQARCRRRRVAADRRGAGSPRRPSWVLAAAALAHLVLVLGEATHGARHRTRAAAVHELTRGRYARWFWVGAALVAVALAAPWSGVPRPRRSRCRPAGPRARLRPGRPGGAAGMSDRRRSSSA